MNESRRYFHSKLILLLKKIKVVKKKVVVVVVGKSNVKVTRMLYQDNYTIKL